MQQKPNYVLIMAGILFLTAAYCTLTDTAKHYEPASLYKEQFLMDGKVISTIQENRPRTECGRTNAIGWSADHGLFFLFCAAAIYYDQFHREKNG